MLIWAWSKWSQVLPSSGQMVQHASTCDSVWPGLKEGLFGTENKTCNKPKVSPPPTPSPPLSSSGTHSWDCTVMCRQSFPRYWQHIFITILYQLCCGCMFQEISILYTWKVTGNSEGEGGALMPNCSRGVGNGASNQKKFQSVERNGYFLGEPTMSLQETCIYLSIL